MIFEANPDYYGEAPRMKKVTVLFMEEDAAYAAALSGQVDLAYTSAAYSDQTMDGFSLFSCETVDNRGFNLPAVLSGETDENGFPLEMISPVTSVSAGPLTWPSTDRP